MDPARNDYLKTCRAPTGRTEDECPSECSVSRSPNDEKPAALLGRGLLAERRRHCESRAGRACSEPPQYRPQSIGISHVCSIGAGPCQPFTVGSVDAVEHATANANTARIMIVPMVFMALSSPLRPARRALPEIPRRLPISPLWARDIKIKTRNGQVLLWSVADFAWALTGPVRGPGSPCLRPSLGGNHRRDVAVLRARPGVPASGGAL